jgi:hypothetical protein
MNCGWVMLCILCNCITTTTLGRGHLIIRYLVSASGIQGTRMACVVLLLFHQLIYMMHLEGLNFVFNYRPI